ncbi:hypothetical protein TTHERM_000090329 (macronuclear) [Tetrahymena thermophila SB210]|uniref:Uncharacterized protein n=1 Tax=Tetrahymena thermophila (strain SB210) TaxID=312017 RepID=W7X740_TETTS|nr:hypothetical protein TTHERM_000090329 [Tetrahymena thermophila SB210]EWS75205.1 hypothetical protein TTHERM_000090329 [Tetrahymena thermophila SB210]|eukprot:XP_012652196.1 hypothetical protein TTHERM_000090329 [Tetrahymena thermophila SB210]
MEIKMSSYNCWRIHLSLKQVKQNQIKSQQIN